ncbi:beta-1,3-galactosyltransferase 5-like [Sipha flava]|uniref:Hexosyltransferase n=2 Tax=Sipha flava TaxID=143950 RepID=A0A8B8G8W2_9HEMI|nr:beta-1,3-galactosyltransferase 5-like [Sipha flava]
MALWRNKIIIFILISLLFVVLFNLLSTNQETYHDVKPKTFYRNTRRLMNLKNFKYVINSDVCELLHPTPIIVHSYIGNFDFRLALRQSYSKTVLDSLGFRYVFMVGLSNSSDVQSRLLQESFQFGDIVQGNFREAYRNLTYKHVMGLTWFTEFCQNSTYMVKMDDDIAVNVFKLKDVIQSNYDLAGCIIKTKPIRDKHNKWYVSKEEFTEETYPAFLSGWLYVAKMTSVQRLLRAIKLKDYFWIDDLYVTGILAERAQICLKDLRSDFEIDPGAIYCCIKKQQRCEFLAAPTGDNYFILQQYSKQLSYCKATNLSCDVFRKSKQHHSCLDLWKKPAVKTQKGKPSIEILN